MFEFARRKDGRNANDIPRLRESTYATGRMWLQKIRDVLVRKDLEPLKGFMQGDETYVGGPEEGVGDRDVGRKKIRRFDAVEVRPPLPARHRACRPANVPPSQHRWAFRPESRRS